MAVVNKLVSYGFVSYNFNSGGLFYFRNPINRSPPIVIRDN